ncbi:MAG: hypothetical protein K2N35_06415 [Muribaculaceae bacterium]|nr:hypothetical protein [Muribaculaceae bacterium]
MSSSFSPGSYPASILVVTDTEMAKCWNLKRIMYLGHGNGGHKFRVYSSVKANHRAASVEMFYISTTTNCSLQVPASSQRYKQAEHSTSTLCRHIPAIHPHPSNRMDFVNIPVPEWTVDDGGIPMM